MENKKNILEICNGLGIGGTEKTMQIFCKYINKDKYNVYCAGLFNDGARKNIIKEFVKDIFVANGDVDKLKKFIIDNNIEIVHWHSITQSTSLEFDKSLELLKFLKENNIKIIETSPFSIYNEQIDYYIDKRLFVSKTSLLKFIWKFGDKLTLKNKYSFVYNPIDISELEKNILNEEEKIKLRQKYGIKPDDFVIGKVGRASLWKWDDTIINIVPRLVKKIPNLKVVIRSIPEIKKKKITKLGLEKYFILLEESALEKDITDTYQLMDLMIHTSRIGESFGISMIEGMFFGLPVITKSTDFMKKTLFDRDNSQIEIVNDSINGYIENDNNKIIEKINLLYSDRNLLKTIGNNNIEYVKNNFSISIIIKDLEQYFEAEYFNTEKFDFSYYKSKIKKERLYDLLLANYSAVYDKFINNA